MCPQAASSTKIFVGVLTLGEQVDGWRRQQPEELSSVSDVALLTFLSWSGTAAYNIHHNINTNDNGMMVGIASFLAGCRGGFFMDGAVDSDGDVGAQTRFSYCGASGFSTTPPRMIRDLIVSVRDSTGCAAHVQKTHDLSRSQKRVCVGGGVPQQPSPHRCGDSFVPVAKGAEGAGGDPVTVMCCHGESLISVLEFHWRELHARLSSKTAKKIRSPLVVAPCLRQATAGAAIHSPRAKKGRREKR